MRKKTSFFFFILFLLFSQFACKHSITKESQTGTETKYATHFSIHKKNNFTILTINEPWAEGGEFTYILAKNMHSIPDSLKKYPFIQIPVKRLVVTSTTHLPFISLLNEEDKLAGFPNTKYISSKEFLERVKKGQIKEIGNGAGINIEETLLLKPDVIVAFSSGNDQKQYQLFEKNKIPVIYNADWMESDPLGRAEWIKVFGLLFGKEKEAEKKLNNIARRYNEIKKKIKSKTKKTKVFQGGFFAGKWYVPGGNSYAARLIEDAGGDYLWKEDKHNGSLPLNYENVLVKLPQADVWLNPGSIISKTALAETFPQAKNMKSFQEDRIYTYALAKGPTGGLIYFEESTARPDKVLQDLYHIFYPEETPDYQFHYYSILLP